MVDPFILAEDGSVVWDAPELLEECNRRRRAKNCDSNYCGEGA
jgi:hypothetical protein